MGESDTPEQQPGTPPHATSQQETDLYILVIAGSHDPRQHQPYWYKLIEILTDEELRTALSNLVLTPDFSTFNAASFAISCDRLRWQIVTPKEENCQRIVDVAKKVFDEKLFQIGVVGIGTNCMLHPETDAKEVGKLLVEAIERGGLIPRIDNKLDGAVTIISGNPDLHYRIDLGQSVFGPTRVSMAYNVHRELPKRDGYYAISGELQHCESDWRHGKKFANELVEKINTLVRQ